MTMLDTAAVPFRIILTKCDKSKAKDMDEIEKKLQQSLKNHPAAHPEFLKTSALKNKGLSEVKAVIAGLV